MVVIWAELYSLIKPVFKELFFSYLILEGYFHTSTDYWSVKKLSHWKNKIAARSTFDFSWSRISLRVTWQEMELLNNNGFLVFKANDLLFFHNFIRNSSRLRKKPTHYPNPKDCSKRLVNFYLSEGVIPKGGNWIRRCLRNFCHSNLFYYGP